MQMSHNSFQHVQQLPTASSAHSSIASSAGLIQASSIIGSLWLLQTFVLFANDLNFAGDVIIGLEGRKVTRAGDLVIALDDFNIGDTVSLTVQRGVGQQQVMFLRQMP